MIAFVLAAFSLAEICRKNTANNRIECVLCTATASEGSRDGIDYIANGVCSFDKSAGTVDIKSGWPLRNGQSLSVPTGVVLDGSVVVRGSMSSITGPGQFTKRIVANDPSIQRLTVSDVTVTDSVAVSLQGRHGRASGFDNTRLENVKATVLGGADVAICNAGTIDLKGVTAIVENVEQLTADNTSAVFSINDELKALSSAFITQITDGVLPKWVATLGQINGWLTAIILVCIGAEYSLYKIEH